jgi:hypothetical protein
VQAQNLKTILGSIVNIIGMGGGIWPFDEHKNLLFNNEQDIYMTFKNYEEHGYDLDWIC